MSLISLEGGWYRYGTGRRWRCVAPAFLCEVDEPGNTPSYLKMPTAVSNLRKVKTFYSGRLTLGMIDARGYGADVIVANCLTESLGSVPSPLGEQELRRVFENSAGIDDGVRLDEVVRYVSARGRYLERREPGYSNPQATPGRVSLGAHHILVSTAKGLLSPKTQTAASNKAAIIDLVCRLPSDSKFSAAMAIEYFNRAYGKHQNQPPLLAATYNAGSPRPDSSNAWNLRQYGQHIDRWIAYFNTSRLLSG